MTKYFSHKRYSIFHIFILLLFSSSVVVGEEITIISANIGAATHGRVYDPSGGYLQMTPDVSLNGVSDLFEGSVDLSSKYIIGLQEVDVGKRRSLWFNQPSFLASKLGGAFNKFQATVDNSYGISLISNHRFNQYGAWNLGCLASVSERDKEKRFANYLKVYSNTGEEMWVINTHFSYIERRAICQVKELLTNIKQNIPKDSTVLVIGDLNIIKNSNEYEVLSSEFDRSNFSELVNNTATFSAWRANRVIDYAFLRDSKSNFTSSYNIRVIEPTLLNSNEYISDHKFLLINLTWRLSTPEWERYGDIQHLNPAPSLPSPVLSASVL